MMAHGPGYGRKFSYQSKSESKWQLFKENTGSALKALRDPAKDGGCIRDLLTAMQAHFPDRAERVLHRIEDLREGKRNDPRFGSRMRGTGIWADLLRQRFDRAVRKAGLNRHRLQLDTQQFIPPAPFASSTGAGFAHGPAPARQLGLFD